jgi:xanthine dehydrogenase YagR molybdenum-binding subunit
MAVLGSPIERVDGRLKVTGAARYVGENQHDRLVHAVLVQSTIARGRIASIDTAAARSAPGVVLVLTHENAPRLQMPKATAESNGNLGEKLLPFADLEIYFAGQNVAVVVAETLEAAWHAASRVRVRYEEERPVLRIIEAAAAESTPHYPEKGLGGRPAQHRRGDVEAALQASDVLRLERTYTIPIETNNAMEPAATVASWQGDRLTVEDSTQHVVGVQKTLAAVFGLPPANVRVLCPFTGGAFGSKGSQWQHTLIAALAARVVKRPVRLTLTRGQMFTSLGHRPPTVQKMTLAARRDGTLTALRHETTNSASPVTEFVAQCGVVTSKSAYACENVDTPTRVVRVNIAAPCPMRAPAECPGSFALESAMDELAYELGLDPLELRRQNFAARDPSNGKAWSANHLEECYARGAERFGWKHRNPKPGSMKDGDLVVGWGMAMAFYPGYRRPSSARVRIAADGRAVRAVVQASTQEIGNGAYTVFTQVSADALGLPVEKVTFELGDADLPEAPIAAGSCSTASVGEAIVLAARALQAKLAAIATHDPESPLAGLAPEQLALVDGKLAMAGNPARGLSYADLLKRARLPAIEAEAHSDAQGDETPTHSIHSFGAQFCEVKIDPLLPRVRVTRFVSVVDVGRVLNPKTSHSQVVGAIVMGLGMALLEETRYDPRTGRPVNANLADYLVPVHGDVEAIEVELLDRPDPIVNTLGCRGVGEIGITGAGAAVANAVYHATGKRIRDLPITLDKLMA